MQHLSVQQGAQGTSGIYGSAGSKAIRGTVPLFSNVTLVGGYIIGVLAGAPGRRGSIELVHHLRHRRSQRWRRRRRLGGERLRHLPPTEIVKQAPAKFVVSPRTPVLIGANGRDTEVSTDTAWASDTIC